MLRGEKIERTKEKHSGHVGSPFLERLNLNKAPGARFHLVNRWDTLYRGNFSRHSRKQRISIFLEVILNSFKKAFFKEGISNAVDFLQYIYCLKNANIWWRYLDYCSFVGSYLPFKKCCLIGTHISPMVKKILYTCHIIWTVKL